MVVRKECISIEMIKIDKNRDALIIVDVQNDFCPGGALAVPHGDEVISLLNGLISYFSHIFATQDWHPPNHISFQTHGGIWPPHCVAGTRGAAFHPALRIDKAVHIKKGTDPIKEAYSGFQGTDLTKRLKKAGVGRLFIGGLATDYCIKASALDALRNGFDVVVLDDAIRGVDVNPGDSAAAIDEMNRSGATISHLSEIVEGAPRPLFS